MDWQIGRGKYFWSNNTVRLETLAVCFHRSLENILLIMAPQLSQQQCVKAPWPMAGIQESPFYVPAKRNFLEKLRNYATITFRFVEWRNKEDETKSKGVQLFLSPTSRVGREGTCCSCQGRSSPKGNWASNLVTWRITCVFWSFFFFFRWREREAVFQNVPGNSI